MKTRLAALAAIMASAFGATAQENQVERSAEQRVLDRYRTVDGIVSPFPIVIQLAGTEEMTLIMKIDKLTHGIEVDDALFAMPKE